MFCSGERGIFVNFNTSSKISLCSRALVLRYDVGQNQGYRIALSDLKKWLLTRKNNNFIEIRVHLIYSNRVPLLHNTVLIYANMMELDWWPCLSTSWSFS